MNPRFIPTRAQIAKACREIRQGWSERTHRLRAGFPAETIDGDYEFPVVAAKDLFGEADDGE